MLNSSDKFITLFAISFFFGGCSTYVPFSIELKQKYQLTNSDLRNIQFYLSKSVSLERELTTVDSKKIAEGHSLRTEKGKLIEVVYFGGKLEGIVSRAYEDSLIVNFEPDKFLTFVKASEPIYHQTPYILLVKDTPGASLVRYDGNDYSCQYLPSESTIRTPALLVIESNLSNVERTKRSASGMRLGDSPANEPTSTQLKSEQNAVPVKDTISAAQKIRELPISERKYVQITTVTGQILEAYLVAESEGFYFICASLDPKEKRSRVDKRIVKSISR